MSGQATIPDHIGRYRVTGRVGKGAMGVVYSAYDEVMGREVAIKVLMADLQGEPTTRTRFYREAQAAGRLLHRNIITVFDIGEDDGRAFIVMELLKGHTLSDFIRNVPDVSLEQKVDLMTQVCEGLQAAHAQGIFHRDVKPGNLFVLADGTLKILDFSVARLASSTLTGTGAVIGTPDYMAPEQARGREVDQRSDVFSSAAVFYFMLSGKKPFTGPTLPAILRNVQFEAPPPLDERDVPPALWRIIAKGLAKQPADRYQSAMEMFSDFVKFRRQHEAETREIASAVLERVRAIEALVDERRRLAAWLGTDEPGGQPIAVLRLRDEAPAFVEQAAGGVLMVPFTRRQIEAVRDEIEAEHRRLLAGVQPLRAARSAVESGERLLGEGDLEGGLRQLEEAGHLVPTAERLRLAGARYFQLRAERTSVGRHLATIDEEARAASLSGRWSAVIDLCDEALAIQPGAPERIAMQSRAREMMDVERRRRENDLVSVLQEANAAIEARDVERAGRMVERARELGAAAPSLEALRDRLAAVQERTAADKERATRLMHELGVARALFDAGRCQDAISALEQLLSREPDAPGIREEIQRLRGQMARAADPASGGPDVQARQAPGRGSEDLRHEVQAAVDDDDTVQMASPSGLDDDTVDTTARGSFGTFVHRLVRGVTSLWRREGRRT